MLLAERVVVDERITRLLVMFVRVPQCPDLFLQFSQWAARLPGGFPGGLERHNFSLAMCLVVRPGNLCFSQKGTAKGQ
jgi:hypothetical protein